MLGVYMVFVGLLVGSFVNLAADRLPRGESVIRPRSHCRACGRLLNPVDLFPVLGYLVRGGRCASCRAPIGIASPVVEGSCAGLMLVPMLVLGVWPGAAAGLALIAFYGLAVVLLSAGATEARFSRRAVSPPDAASETVRPVL